MCKVVHCKKDKYDVYIGRPSIWGNPFSHKEDTLAKFKVSSRKEAIEQYEHYLLNNKMLMEKLFELKNKTLGCFCSPKSCHGDILKKYVDRLEEDLPTTLF